MKTYIIREFKEFFNDVKHNDTGFVFVGNIIPYANSDTNITEIYDTKVDERSAWESMIVAKKINPSDVELVAPRLNWTGNVTYKQYDDTISKEILLSSDPANNIFSMVVINSEGNIYKCLSNNLSRLSTQEPTNNYTITDGFIETSDGYIWKYLYNVKFSNKFLTNDWMPVPFTGDLTVITTEYNINNNSIIPGTINNIVVETGGNNYIHSTKTASSFGVGSSFINLNDIGNVAVNMSISGVGILPGTYITSITQETNSIFLSNKTINNGGGVANNISITTRVDIIGDGVDALAEVILTGDSISKIMLDSIGSNYSRANVLIYGTATDNVAVVRPIFSYRYGHGYNPAIELASSNMMILKKFGEIDSTEEGVLSTDIIFRQYGVMMNPHIYGNTSIINYFSSNNTISQTYDLTLESGSLYNLNDFVYQGSPSEPIFSGIVVSQDALIVKLTSYKGKPDIGSLLTNGTISRPLSAVKLPGFEPYSGELLYITNIAPIQRSEGQSEEIKIIITV